MLEAKVFAPLEENSRIFFSKINQQNADKIVLGKFRASDSPKQFLFAFSELVAQYFDAREAREPAKTILFGVKACDLSAINVLDQVYLEGDFKDIFYQQRRENTVIITSDCTNATPFCFCTLIGGQPYAKEGFDLNISILDEGYLVDIGSQKGQDLIDKYSGLFSDISRNARTLQEEKRAAITENVKEINKKFTTKAELKDIHQYSIESPAWRNITKNCVECSLCNRACPSCSCFLLVDQKDKSGNQRTKFWDNCMQGAYTKVAGGGNPRALLRNRLENRYECKFNYSHERLGRYTCVGCGRCIEGCMANIDMREAFKALEQQIVLSAKLV